MPGGTANIALGFEVPLAETRTVDVRPIQGTFQIAGARIIAPGDPSRSVLYYRVSKLGGGRMPRVGSDEVDVRAVRMLHDWIAADAGERQGPRRGPRGHPGRGPDRARGAAARRSDRRPRRGRRRSVG